MRLRYTPNGRGLMRFGIAWMLFCIALGITMVVGWIMNIADLLGMENVLSTGEGIVRVVGIFIPPLGAFMGIFW